MSAMAFGKVFALIMAVLMLTAGTGLAEGVL